MQDWFKDMMEEWNKECDKEVMEEWLREPEVLPGQGHDNTGENYTASMLAINNKTVATLHDLKLHSYYKDLM